MTWIGYQIKFLQMNVLLSNTSKVIKMHEDYIFTKGFAESQWGQFVLFLVKIAHF